MGRKLWGLTAQGEAEGIAHQVLCITHLPQLAAYGDLHFHVAKRVAGQRTVTNVQNLSGDERVSELADMMGADSQAGRASVVEIMSEVEQAKAKSERAAAPGQRKAR